MTFTKLFAAGIIAACGVNAANAAVMHVHDEFGTLATVDTVDGNVSIIGGLGTVMTDIAFDPNGNLYGISFGSLYLIDPLTAATTYIGDHGIANGNALVFGNDGTLYGAGVSTTELFTIDVGTAAATALGDTGFASGGDLAFVGDSLYLASATNALVSIDLADIGASSVVGAFGVGNVFGIASPGDGSMFGVGGTTIFQVDLLTGMALNAVDFSGQGLGVAFGQSFSSEAVVPVPAALPLMASALALYGIIFRRRKQ